MATTAGSSRTTSSRTQFLSPATLAAQQRLSERHGIATFTTSGKISTVPSLQRGFSDINVGLGSFKSFNDFAQAAVNKQIYNELHTRKTTGRATIQNDDGRFDTVTAHEDTPFFTNDPRNPSNFGRNDGSFGDSFDDKFKTSIFNQRDFGLEKPSSGFQLNAGNLASYIPYIIGGIALFAIGIPLAKRLIRKI